MSRPPVVARYPGAPCPVCARPIQPGESILRRYRAQWFHAACYQALTPDDHRALRAAVAALRAASV